jgi:hydrogenase maturation protease
MIRIIGIGSPFGDDRAAWEVIAELAGNQLQQVDLVTLNQPGAGLINWFDGVERLILVDTLLSPEPAPAFLCIDPEALAAGTSRLSSHGQQLRETLALATTLNCLPARTEIYAVALPDVDPENLNLATVQAAHALAQHLAARIKSAGHPAPQGEQPENNGQ